MSADNGEAARLWLVYGPTRPSHYSVMGEPPEPTACVVEVEAVTRRDALIVASKTSEMQDHAVEMRDDNRPPWHLLSAEPIGEDYGGHNRDDEQQGASA